MEYMRLKDRGQIYGRMAGVFSSWQTAQRLWTKHSEMMMELTHRR